MADFNDSATDAGKEAQLKFQDARILFRSGEEDQIASLNLKAVISAGDTHIIPAPTDASHMPRYPGIAYLEFFGWPLNDYNGRVPSDMKVEVIKGLDILTWPEMWSEIPNTPWAARSSAGAVSHGNQLYIIGGFRDTGDPAELNDMWVTVRGTDGDGESLWSDLLSISHQDSALGSSFRYNTFPWNGGVSSFVPIIFSTDAFESTGIPTVYSYIIIYCGSQLAQSVGQRTLMTAGWKTGTGTRNYKIGVAYNLEKEYWVPIYTNLISNTSETPFPREAYAMCNGTVPGGTDPCIYISGGNNNNTIYPHDNQTGSGNFNDLWYSTDGVSWTEISASKNDGIDGVSTVNKTFTINGVDLTGIFISNIRFSVLGSTDNDDRYTTVSSILDSGNTVITVLEAISDPTPDGSIYWTVGINYYRHDHQMLFFENALYILGGRCEEFDNGNKSNSCIRIDISLSTPTLTVQSINAMAGIPPISPDPGAGDIWGSFIWRDKMVSICTEYDPLSSYNMKTIYTEDLGETWQKIESLLGGIGDTWDHGAGGAFPVVASHNDYMFVMSGAVSGVVHNEVWRTEFVLNNSAGKVSLQTVIESELITEGKLDSSRLDASDCGDIYIDGVFFETRQKSADNLAPLLLAYGVDIIETEIDSGGYKLYFRKRSSAVTGVTILQDDLQPYNDTEELKRYLNLDIQMFYEIPTEMDITYLDKGDDYKVNMQTAQIAMEDAAGDGLFERAEKLEINLPLILTSDRARQIAYRVLGSLWLERGKFPLRLGLKYFKITQGDIFDIVLDDIGTFTVRSTGDKLIDKLIVEHDCVLEDIQLWDLEDSIGVDADYTNPGIVSISPNAVSKFLDIPIMGREEFEGFGFFFTTWVETDNKARWKRTRLWKYGEELQPYTLLGECNVLFPTATVVDISNLVLTKSDVMWDEESYIDVTMSDAVLGPATADQVYLGSNLCVCGNELIQFRDVIEQGSSVYRLFGLIRGLYGTRSFIGVHAENETFVLLDGNVNGQRIRLNTGQKMSLHKKNIGLSEIYKVADDGQDLRSLLETEFTCNSITTKPFSPAWVNGNRQGSWGDWKIRFAESSRYTSGLGLDCFQESSDPPLFKITFYESDFSTVIFFRELDFSSKINQNDFYEIILSGREQLLTDGPFNEQIQSTLYVGIVQYSENYPLNDGYGYEKQVTLEV